MRLSLGLSIVAKGPYSLALNQFNTESKDNKNKLGTIRSRDEFNIAEVWKDASETPD
jgi:hypothetical protein